MNDESIPTPPSSGPRTWTVGTLTYGVGGLLLLFVLLLGGDFAWSMRERAIGPLFQLLLRKFQASDLFVGLFTGSIPAGITLLVYPIVSTWSDRHRGRWGRRIPFLFVPTPFLVLSMAGLAFAPQIAETLRTLFGSSASLNVWILGVFGVLWVLFEVFALVTNAVFYGLVNDVVPRAFIGRFFAVFRMASLGAGIWFNYSLFAYGEMHSREVFLAIAAIYLVGFTIMCLFVKEGGYPPPEPVENANPFASIGRYLKECASHPFYRLAFVTLGLAGLMATPVNLFSLFMAKSFAMPTDLYGKTLAATYVCSMILSFPIGWITDRLHPMRTAFAAAALYGVTMTVGYFAIHDQVSFGIFFLLHGVLSGTFFTASLAVYPALFPRSKFGQYYSAYMVVQNVLALVLSPLLGRILDLTHHAYLLTFLFGGLLSLATLVCWTLLYRRFRALGGVASYAPPEIR